jgi:hypothetical protein
LVELLIVGHEKKLSRTADQVAINERRKISAWRNVEKYLRYSDVENVSVAIQLTLQIERVPYVI